MTPAQLEHLRRIDAHLANLLSTAEKRTPGEWDTLGVANSNSLRLFAGNRYLGMLGNSDADKREVQSDAAFIASCAGNAEAGWKATRAAIAVILNCNDNSFPHMYAAIQVSQMADSILSAFPLKLIQKP